MAVLPTVAIVVADKKEDVNKIATSMGEGAPFSVKLCAAETVADENTPPTHWLFANFGCEESMSHKWSAMATGLGVLPLGIDLTIGGILPNDAQLAIGSANLRVYTSAGCDNTDEYWVFLNAIFDSSGLKRVPDPPV